MLYISTLAAIFCGDMYMKIRLPNNPSYDGPKPHFIHMTVLLRRGPSWSYGSWIPNYKCTYAISDYHHFSWRGVLDTTLCDKDCQWLVAGLWFSPVSLVSSTNKTDHRNIVESGIETHNPNHNLTINHMIPFGSICWKHGIKKIISSVYGLYYWFFCHFEAFIRILKNHICYAKYLLFTKITMLITSSS